MPRKKRFYRLNSCHHVMLRGNNGQDIFFDDVDRIRFCLLLQAASEKHVFQIHAFCFMNNHIHLILEPQKGSLQEGVHAFSFRYAQYFNRRYGRRGYVFQGRFRSICVEDGLYLKRLVRYIHQNPVQAGLVQSPQDYFWSSHRTYLGINDNVWLHTDKVLSRFAPTRKEALEALVEFVNRERDGSNDVQEILKAFRMGYFGEEDLIDEDKIPLFRIEQKSPVYSLEAATNWICEYYQISLQELTSPSRRKILVDARAVLSFLARRATTWNFVDLSLFLGRDASSISRLASRAELQADLKNIAEKFSG